MNFFLNQARLISQNKPIVVLMSGNYVQRGQISICDKWSRAKSALLSGADLVFELPFLMLYSLLIYLPMVV